MAIFGSMASLRATVLALVTLTLLAHLLALALSNADAVSTPISQLSHGAGAWIHSGGLLALCVAWWVLALLLSRRTSSGRLWQVGYWLCALNAPITAGVCLYFLLAPDAVLFGPDANDPLAILASTTGIAMAALQQGVWRQSPALGIANASIFVVWMGLVVAIPFVTSDGLGAYERIVGAVMLTWIVVLARVPLGIGGEAPGSS